jgi:hypothetical protein
MNWPRNALILFPFFLNCFVINLGSAQPNLNIPELGVSRRVLLTVYGLPRERIEREVERTQSWDYENFSVVLANRAIIATKDLIDTRETFLKYRDEISSDGSFSLSSHVRAESDKINLDNTNSLTDSTVINEVFNEISKEAERVNAAQSGMNISPFQSGGGAKPLN